MTDAARIGKGTLGLTVTMMFFTLTVLRECDSYQRATEGSARREAGAEAYVSASNARRAAAAQEGRHRDTQACVALARARCRGQSSCDTCTDDLFGCLETARRDDAYCATVPRYTVETADASEAWRDAQRDEAGLTDWTCSAMWKFVQLHCHPLAP